MSNHVRLGRRATAILLVCVMGASARAVAAQAASAAPADRPAHVAMADPAPLFDGAVSALPATIFIGQSFTISLSVTNYGGTSPDGRIAISFPSLDQPADAQRVASSSIGDSPGFVRRQAGGTVNDAACQTMTAPCLSVEYSDNDWQGGESNAFSVSVQPRQAGMFYFYVRSSLAVAGASCAWVTALPANGETGFTDPQGFAVRRFAVMVAATAPPTPSISVVSIYPATIALGQTFTIVASGNDDLGGPSGYGRVVIGFPGLTHAGDESWVTGSFTDTPGYLEHPAGSAVLSQTCQPLTASYLAVEGVDDDWQTREINTCTVVVQPPAVGNFVFEVRCTLDWTAGGPCSPFNVIPPLGTGPAIDQQGFQVTRFAVTVTSPYPTPAFSAPISGLPASLVLGQSFTLSAVAGNSGTGASDDGRIAISFPAFTHPGDEQWISSASLGDLPGYSERPAGSPLLRSNCQAMTAGYLVAEYDDSNWMAGETNDLSLTVQPQAVGTFYIDVRATLRIPGGGACAYANALPEGPASTVDQQGWAVRRFAVEVLPAEPPGPVTSMWSRLTPAGTGPSARFSASMVYHPARDALVLYGGSDGHYRTDAWTLPLAPGAAWSALAPGGPVPLARIMHSMVLNPIEDQLVIFGGLYDDVLNDLTSLALSPIVWWFPATPSGTQPAPRFGQTAVYDAARHRMLVIGGYGTQLLNDVWEYPLPGNGTWTQLTPSGSPMMPRTNHAAVLDPLRDRVLVFGGDAGALANDVWELRLGPLQWSRLQPTGTPPAARREHSMIYDAGRDRLLVFGGFGATRFNDVWALSLASEPPFWTQIYSSTSPPSPRMEHAAVYDPVRDRMLVFGGNVGTNLYSSELWALNFDAPTAALVAFDGAWVTPDRVRLSWSVSGALAEARVARSNAGSRAWLDLGPASLDGDRLRFEDDTVVPGMRYAYRLREEPGGTPLDLQWIEVPSRAVLALAGASPNPTAADLWITFSLPSQGAATLALFDLEGRMIAQREVGGLGPGEHRVMLARPGDLRAGVYLVRLVRNHQVLRAKACVVR